MSTVPAPGTSEPQPENPENPENPESPERPESARPKPEQAKPRPKLDFGDPLDQQSSDDTDQGWGGRPSAGGGAADLARFLDEKPPHHI